MKSFFLSFFFVSSVFAATPLVEKPIVISGFDDVLRQAENTGLIKAALKIFEDDKTFTGMPELYLALSGERSAPNFYIVSAISHWFEKRINHFLTDTKFPSNQRYLRNWLTQWSIEKFKVEKIKEIISKNPHQKFIVIFDNSDASLDLVNKLYLLFPDQIVRMYLHQVVKKQMPINITAFYTAFDIAVSEYNSRRMSLKELEAIGAAVVNEKNKEMLFPSYAICPKDYSLCPSITPKTIKICAQVRAHIQLLCGKK